VTNSQTIHIVGLLPLADVKPRKKLDESPAERQEDLRQVQGDSPARSRDGDLREPAAQAAAGLSRANCKTNQAASVGIARAASKLKTCDRKSRTMSLDPPSVGGRGPGDQVALLDRRQPGTHHARHLRDAMRLCLSKGVAMTRQASTRRKVIRPNGTPYWG
jgi:hypothetical protein